MEKFGGIISLIDIYYFYNKKRQTGLHLYIALWAKKKFFIALIAPEEIIKACERFPIIGAPLKLVTLDSGVKVIESIK